MTSAIDLEKSVVAQLILPKSDNITFEKSIKKKVAMCEEIFRLSKETESYQKVFIIPEG